MTEEEVRARFRSHFDEYLETMDEASVRLRMGMRGAAILARSLGAAQDDIDAVFASEVCRANEIMEALAERQSAITN